MLLGFGGRNFYSFKEDFDISLESKKGFLNLLGIKGANASGKTNVVRALSFLCAFMYDSFTQFQPDEGMYYKPFFDSDKETTLYIHFKVDKFEYKYEIVFTKDGLLSEKLSRKENRWVIMLLREKNTIINALSEFNKFYSINIIRENVSIISLAYQYGLKELDLFYTFAKNITINVNMMGKMTNNEHFLDYKEISKIYFQEKKLLDTVSSLLRKADTGIQAIKIVKVEDKLSKDIVYEPLFHHEVNGKFFKLKYKDESSGTQLLYRQLGVYLNTLSIGSIVAYDEFDIGLHPDLSLMVMDLFEDKTINKNAAQLIFTSHHSEVIDKLGKYRLVFVNKEDNESYLYRLDEITGDILRPDRSIMPAYNSHKIGGRPKVVG